MKMDFGKYNNKAKAKIGLYLYKYLDSWKKNAKTEASQLSQLIDLFAESINGGKMIRGTLIVLGYEMFAGKANPEIYKVAAAYEIMHASLLIHDDAIDRSRLRRFRPSIYQTLGANHYAISQSIVLGDLGFFTAIEILQNTEFKDKLKSQASALFLQTISSTILGEGLDIEFADKKQAQIDDILSMYELKTANYTISTPLALGALLGGCNPKILPSIEEFGKNLGTAFQIRDDILGIFGDEKEIGKSITSDITEGKVTLLLIHLQKNGNPEEVAFVNKTYGKERITLQQHRQIKKIFQNSGALKLCQQKIADLSAEAKKLIPNITKDKKYQQFLEDLANDFS